MGAPGSGKGTIAKRMIAKFGMEVISTGDLIRDQIRAETDMGKQFKELVAAGQLVPADVVMGLVDAGLEEYADKNWMLDGFPRSVEQAALLDAKYKIDFAVNIDVPFDTIVGRLSSRWTHGPSGRIYNIDYSPPKVPFMDDETGEPLEQREDDKPETVAARLNLYVEETQPLLDHYGADGMNLLKSFTGTESDVIYPLVEAHLLEIGIPPV